MKFSIKGQLVSYFVLFTFIASATLGILSFVISTDIIEKNIVHSFQVLVHKTEYAMDLLEQAHFDSEPQSFQINRGLQKYLDMYYRYGKKNSQVQALEQSNLDYFIKVADVFGYSDFVVLDDEGTVLFGTLAGTSSLAHRDYWQKAAQTKEIVVSDIFYSDIQNSSVIATCTPILAGDTGRYGYVVNVIDMKNFTAILHEGNKQVGESVDVYLFNDEGIWLTDSRLTVENEAYQKRVNVNSVGQKETWDALIAKNYNFEFQGIYKDYRGIEVLGLGSLIQIGDTYYGFMVEINSSEVFANVYSMLFQNIIAFLIVMILAIVVAFINGNRFAKPVQYLQERIMQLAEDDYSGIHSLNQKFLKRGDEIGEALRAYETMLLSITDTLSGVKNAGLSVASGTVQLNAAAGEQMKANQQLSDIANNVSSAVNQMASSNDHVRESIETLSSTVEEISATINEMALSLEAVSGDMQNTDISVSQVSASIEELGASVNEVAENAQNAGDRAQNNFDKAKEGGRLAQEVQTGMTQILKSVQTSQDVINRLHTSSEKISEIIDTIAEIADQTNLLALNAAIEAARAGEAGKGFAVVADEIRRLAEKTTKSTREINNMIREIQERTDNAVVSMKQGMNQVESGNQLVDSMKKSLEEIVKQARLSSEGIDQIVRATSEQANAINLVVQETIKVQQASGSANAATQENARGGEQIKTAIEQIVNLVLDIVNQTQEQGRAIGSVQDATQSMVAIAEETASTTNETASTTKEISQLAEELGNIIRKFKLDGESNLSSSNLTIRKE